jgi:hypothetical protein
MWQLGYRSLARRMRERKTIVAGDAISFGLFACLAAVLSFHVPGCITRQILESDVRTRLRLDLLEYPSAELLEVRFVSSVNTLSATAIVRTAHAFTLQQVADMEATLPVRGRMKVKLRVRSLITYDTPGAALRQSGKGL